MSEYQPIVRAAPADDGPDRLERVEDLFDEAAGPYLVSPLPWIAWAVLLPTAALTTSWAFERGGNAAVLGLWSAVVVLCGGVEVAVFARSGARSDRLARHVFRNQANLSLIGVALSTVLLLTEHPAALPGLWLLLFGHSFLSFGQLALPAFRTAGRIYQVGGIAALLPFFAPLVCFAIATALGNLWIAAGVHRRAESADSP